MTSLYTWVNKYPADEVRALGRLLSIPAPLVQRHPFPGPGLAIRILGPVNRAQVAILQHADTIFIEEIRAAGLYDQIAQAFAVLLPVRAVGVQGDVRTYEQVIALRAVQSEDFMTADWFVFEANVLRKVSGRITNEVEGVNRVVYDISSKPPAVSRLIMRRTKALTVFRRLLNGYKLDGLTVFFSHVIAYYHCMLSMNTVHLEYVSEDDTTVMGWMKTSNICNSLIRSTKKIVIQHCVYMRINIARHLATRCVLLQFSGPPNGYVIILSTFNQNTCTSSFLRDTMPLYFFFPSR